MTEVQVRECNLDGSDAVFAIALSGWMLVELRVGRTHHLIEPKLDPSVEETVLLSVARWASSHASAVPYEIRRRLAALVCLPS